MNCTVSFENELVPHNGRIGHEMTKDVLTAAYFSCTLLSQGYVSKGINLKTGVLPLQDQSCSVE